MDRHVARLSEADAYALALAHVPLAIVLTNPHLDDNPIIYVNHAFETVTGYSKEAALGRNCRFLQGADSSRETAVRLGEQFWRGEEATVDLLNYRADGSPFWNRVHVKPLYDESGNLQFFMGTQRVLGSRREAAIAGGSEDVPLHEVTHRVKNHLAMVVSMIRTQARASSVEVQPDFATLARRVESLQLLYHEMSDNGVGTVSEDRVSLDAYVKRVTEAVSSVGSDGGIETVVDAAPVQSSPEAAAQIGLVLSEILTNAYQHAFAGRGQGRVAVQLRPGQGLTRLQVSDNGVGLPADRHWPESGSLGGRIVRSLVSGLDATLQVERLAVGTCVTIDIPLREGARL